MFKLKSYTTQELLYISVLSAIGLAIKPIVTPLVHLVSTPLLLPGGSLAGGFYMMWLVLAALLVRKFGSAFLTGFLQGIVVLSLGYFGNHGAISLVSYSLPGLAVDISAIVLTRKHIKQFCLFSAMLANLTGTVIVTFFVMRLPLLPFLIALITSAVSGIIGGLLSFKVFIGLKKYGIYIKEKIIS